VQAAARDGLGAVQGYDRMAARSPHLAVWSTAAWVERHVPSEQSEEAHPERPHIHGVRVRLALDHLGRHVRDRADMRAVRIVGFQKVVSEAKVGHLDVSVVAVVHVQEVLWLQVAVYDLLGFQVRQCRAHLSNDTCGSRLGERPPLNDALKDLSGQRTTGGRLP